MSFRLWLTCVNPDDLDGFVSYGHKYRAERLPLGALWILSERGWVVLCGERFRYV